MMTLYTVIGLYGRLDRYFVFYCTWDIWKAFPFQPDGFMLFLELNSDFWAREAYFMDIEHKHCFGYRR